MIGLSAKTYLIMKQFPYVGFRVFDAGAILAFVSFRLALDCVPEFGGFPTMSPKLPMPSQ
jgi:hypothetical protein